MVFNSCSGKQRHQLCSHVFRKKDSAKPLADKYGIDKIYTDLDEMLQDEDINFVYVASPNSLHFKHSLKALQAGKHVICEKPFTSTVDEFDILVDTAKNILYLFEAIVSSYASYLNIKQLPRLGTIRMVQCNFSQYSSRYDILAGETPNVFNPEFSGGASSNINIYNLHYVIGLFGKPTEIHYYANKHTNGIDTSGVAAGIRWVSSCVRRL
ncbi:MAG: Gfo/Idh/MocA family protein [[Clostridium] innocuum]